MSEEPTVEARAMAELQDVASRAYLTKKYLLGGFNHEIEISANALRTVADHLDEKLMPFTTPALLRDIANKLHPAGGPQ